MPYKFNPKHMAATLSIEENLQERVKELSCLYEISHAIIEHNGSVEDTLTIICGILKKAWRFPEDAVVELHMAPHHVFSKPLSGKTVFQTSTPLISNHHDHIKVHYPATLYTAAHFLPEEQQLLDKAAYEISTFLKNEAQKEKEELMQRSLQRNDRLAILGEITAGIAHELNTPLGNILGFAEFISEATHEKQTKTDAEKVIKAAIYSREVVKKLMFFACEMPQNMELIALKPVIEQALTLLEPNFKKANVAYSFEMKSPDLKAQLDSIQLTQVLFNVLINAIYVSPEGSSIQIRVFAKAEDLFIEIADEGPGIDPNIKSRIFEPFFTTKPLGEGSGLGLSVVHGIVKSHRGDIRALDNVPRGTVFQIRLPLKAS